MANLNKVLLIGRLTRDPELRYTPGGLAVADFGLAVNRFRKAQDGNRQEETAFVDMTAFGRTAELANQYLSKGRQAFFEGHLRFEQWTNKDGQKRSKLTVVVDNMQFLDARGEGGGGVGRSPAEDEGPAPRGDFDDAPMGQAPDEDFGNPDPPPQRDIPF